MTFVQLACAAVSIGALAACAGSEAENPALQNAPKIPYEQLQAASGSAQALQQVLADSTFEVPTLAGVHYWYLAADGRAYSKQPRNEVVSRGGWRVIPTLRGGPYVCASLTPLPADISIQHQSCMSAAEFMGNTFFPVRGDPLGLSAN